MAWIIRFLRFYSFDSFYFIAFIFLLLWHLIYILSFKFSQFASWPEIYGSQRACFWNAISQCEVCSPWKWMLFFLQRFISLLLCCFHFSFLAFNVTNPSHWRSFTSIQVPYRPLHNGPTRTYCFCLVFISHVHVGSQQNMHRTAFAKCSSDKTLIIRIKCTQKSAHQ